MIQYNNCQKFLKKGINMYSVTAKRDYNKTDLNSSKQKNQKNLKKQRPLSAEEQVTSLAIDTLPSISFSNKLPDSVLGQVSPVSVAAFSQGESLPEKPALESKKSSLLYEKHMKDFGASIKWFQERFPPLSFK